MKLKWRKRAALALAALACALPFSGCAGEEPATSIAAPVVVKNSGRDTSLVLGCLDLDGEREAALQEIAAKYRADFPNTEIEIKAFDSPQAMEEALRTGEADLGEVRGEDQAGYVEEGLLFDFREYLAGWEESDTLTSAAKAVLNSMGSAHAYVFLNRMEQKLFFYRSDWFKEYNDQVEPKERAYCETWDQIVAASEKLGDRGKLAYAGKESLLDYFDGVLWSGVTLGDPGASYLTVDADTSEAAVSTVFSQEQAAAAAEQFLQIAGACALPESADWTTVQAVKAFQDGKAGMLLADRSAIAVLRDSLPEGSWTALGLPKGLNGVSVSPITSFRGWGISAAAKDWETAFHFLTFLCNADNNTHYAKVCGCLPIHLEAEDMEASLAEGDLAPEMDMIQKGNQYQYAMEPVLYKACADWRTEADRKLREFLSGASTQAELLGWMDEFWGDAAKEGNLWE